MPRKDIDVTDEHLAHMDQVRTERRLTYSQIVQSALETYFAPKPENPDPILQSRVHAGLDQIQQRLWNLDSASQKTVERLAQLETLAQDLPTLAAAIDEELATIQQVLSALVKAVEGITHTRPLPEAATPDVTPVNPGWYKPSTESEEEYRARRGLPPLVPTSQEMEAPPTEKRSWWRKGSS